MEGFGRIVDELNKSQAYMKASDYAMAAETLKRLWNVRIDPGIDY